MDTISKGLDREYLRTGGIDINNFEKNLFFT